MQFQIRSLTTLDEVMPFVISSWRKHCRTVPPFVRYDNEEYDLVTGNLSSLVMSHVTLIAHVHGEPNQCVGYACGSVRGRNQDLQILYFVYVKDAFRQQRIATELMHVLFPSFGNHVTYVIFPGRSTRYLECKWNLRINPYLLQR